MDSNNCEESEEFDLTRIRRLNSNTVRLDHDVVIYPNPSPGPIIILPRNIHLKGIQIFDSFGQQKLKIEDIQLEKLELDLTNYSSGIYYMHLSSHGQVIVKKLILSR